MSAYDLVKFAHAGIGGLALLSFWTAGFTRKGSALHINAGRVYLCLLLAVLVSGVPLTVRRFLIDGFATGLFFVHLLVLVSLASFVAWRAIRDKRDWRRFAGPVYRALAWTVLSTGVSTAVVGAQHGNVIFIAFGLLGLRIWWDMSRFAKKGPEAPNWWMVQHYRAMIGNGIATHIAFLLIGLPRLLPNANGAILTYAGWLLPLSIGLGVQFVLDRRYRVRKAAPVRVPA